MDAKVDARQIIHSQITLHDSSSIERKNSIKKRERLSMPISPLTNKGGKGSFTPGMVLLPLKSTAASTFETEPAEGGERTSCFNPEGVIFIPNYHNNKKPKIIKLSELAQIVSQGPSGDSTTLGGMSCQAESKSASVVNLKGN